MFFTSEGEDRNMAVGGFRGCPYADYYVRQAGSGVSQYYAGAPYQKGYGLGSFLRGLFRSALPLFSSAARSATPMLQSAAKAIGVEAAKAGGNILNDLANHRPLSQSLREQWDTSKTNLAQKAQEKVQRLVGNGAIKKRKRAASRQSGTGKRSKRTTSTSKKKKAPKGNKKKKQTKKKKKKATTGGARRRSGGVSFSKTDIFS